MGMTPSGRATAIYNAIESSNPAFAQLSPDEKSALLTSLETIWGSAGGGNGDLAYIQGNATVNPGSFSNSGGPVTGAGTIS